MKSIAIALFFLSAIQGYGKVNPQPQRFEHQDECGDPTVESMSWALLEGTAVEVLDGRTFLLKTASGERVRVELGGLGLPVGTDARESLSSRILNRPVEVMANQRSREAPSVLGVVSVDSRDINREMLQAGLAKFEEPPAYQVSSYTTCLYRIAEREAKETKRGLWGNAARETL